MANYNKNFKGHNLSGRSFKGQDLTAADFSDCDLRGVDFSFANLTDAKFCNARMGRTLKASFIVFVLQAILVVAAGFILLVGNAFSAYLTESILKNIGNNSINVYIIYSLLFLGLA